MRIWKQIIIFIILLTLGFGYRYILSSYRPDNGNLEGDEYENQVHASEILNGIPAGTITPSYFRNYGYSAFLAGIEYFFGPDNLFAIRISQICLDLITALLVYFTAKRLWSDKTAFLSFILYLSNPFIASFAHYRFAEVLTTFIVALIAYAMSLTAFKVSWIFWIFWGFLLGIFVFVRYHFLSLVSVVMILSGLLFFKKILSKLLFVVCALMGFLISSSYTLYANYTVHKVITITPPYTSTWGMGFMPTFYMDFRWPELMVESEIQNDPDLGILYHEYAYTSDGDKYRYDQKYKQLFFQKLQTDWPIFLNNYLHNIIWTWDKYHLSELWDLWYPADTIPLRFYNIGLCLFFIIGMIAYIIKKGIRSLSNPVFLFTLIFFLFMSFLIPLVSTESRHSLPFYSLLIMWSGFGLNICISKFGEIKKYFRKTA
jgi:4-amino-4-deoxy-L-arabinose transferase-like glycosyltransferase